MLAASVSFSTPFEPSCLLVYGPGRYRFRDFVVVGGGLTLLLALVCGALDPDPVGSSLTAGREREAHRSGVLEATPTYFGHKVAK